MSASEAQKPDAAAGGAEGAKEADQEPEEDEEDTEAPPTEAAHVEDRKDRNQFQAVFRTESTAIQDAVKAFVISPEASDANVVNKTLDELLIRVQRLEEEYTRFSQILKPYDQQACIRQLRGMMDEIAKHRERLAPRKKFGFRRKAAPAKPDADSAAAIGAAAKAQPSPAVAAEAASAGEVIKDLQGEVVLLRPGALAGRDVTLRALQNCRIVLLDHIGALHCHELRACEVVAGAIGSSALLYNCSGCVLTLAAKQLRLHESREMSLHLHTKSNPVIEHCQRIAVSPFDLWFPELPDLWAAAGLGNLGGLQPLQSGVWREVQDFNWHRRQASPNWCLVHPGEQRPQLEFQELEAAAAALGPSASANAAAAVAEALDRYRSRWEAAEADVGRPCSGGVAPAPAAEAAAAAAAPDAAAAPVEAAAAAFEDDKEDEF